MLNNIINNVREEVECERFGEFYTIAGGHSPTLLEDLLTCKKKVKSPAFKSKLSKITLSVTDEILRMKQTHVPL